MGACPRPHFPRALCFYCTEGSPSAVGAICDRPLNLPTRATTGRTYDAIPPCGGAICDRPPNLPTRATTGRPYDAIPPCGRGDLRSPAEPINTGDHRSPLRTIFMNQLPKRKPNRIPEFDYSTPGAYFLTICTQKREPILWSSGRGDLRSPADICLSDIGNIVDDEIGKMNGIYANVKVDKYCIMPDHIHMIITISEEFPPLATPPNIPRIIQQFKGVVTKRAKRSIWQKT